ncbi:MAG: hypothetical protein GY850_19585, partial [bacterium]|nr:hypothetical protein [bacterium]
ALNLNIFGKFTYTHETILDLAFKNMRIVEVPLQVRGVREFGKSKVANNLWKYGINALKIIFRTYRDYKPMTFFGTLSLSSFCMAAGLGLFFFLHYFLTGRFSPHLWAGFSSGFLIMMGFVLFTTGLLADMLDRIRKNQDEIIYYEKRRTLNKN